MSRGEKQKCVPHGTGAKKAERFLRWWEDMGTTHNFSNFIFQPVNLIPLQLLFLFFTSRWQMVQRFSWVYY